MFPTASASLTSAWAPLGSERVLSHYLVSPSSSEGVYELTEKHNPVRKHRDNKLVFQIGFLTLGFFRILSCLVQFQVVLMPFPLV